MLFLLCDLALRTYAYFIKKKEGKLYQFSLLFYLFPTFFMSLLFLRCVVHNHSYHVSAKYCYNSYILPRKKWMDNKSTH